MAKIGRPTKAVVVTDDERRALIRLTTRARVNRSLAFRARLVLACAGGVADSAVARRYRTKDATVGNGAIGSSRDGLTVSMTSRAWAHRARFRMRTSKRCS